MFNRNINEFLQFATTPPGIGYISGAVLASALNLALYIAVIKYMKDAIKKDPSAGNIAAVLVVALPAITVVTVQFGAAIGMGAGLTYDMGMKLFGGFNSYSAATNEHQLQHLPALKK